MGSQDRRAPSPPLRPTNRPCTVRAGPAPPSLTQTSKTNEFAPISAPPPPSASGFGPRAPTAAAPPRPGTAGRKRAAPRAMPALRSRPGARTDVGTDGRSDGAAVLSPALPFSPPGRPPPTAQCGDAGGGGGGRGGGLSPLRPHEGRGKKQITTTIPPPNLAEMSRKGATFAFLSKTQRGQNPPAPARLSLQSAVRCNLPNG